MTTRTLAGVPNLHKFKSPYYKGTSYQGMLGSADAFAKWWKAHVFTQGQVIQSLSPYEQNVMQQLWITFADKTVRKVRENFFPAVPIVAGFIGTAIWADYQYEENLKAHRY